MIFHTEKKIMKWCKYFYPFDNSALHRFDPDLIQGPILEPSIFLVSTWPDNEWKNIILPIFKNSFKNSVGLNICLSKPLRHSWREINFCGIQGRIKLDMTYWNWFNSLQTLKKVGVNLPSGHLFRTEHPLGRLE